MQRVLIADADPATRDLYQSYLWDCGYDIETAETGSECVVMVREFTPQVLLLDAQLPFDGIAEILSQLEQAYPGAALPVILVVSGDQETDWSNQHAGLIHAILTKPLRLHMLVEAIDSAIAAAVRQSQGDWSPSAHTCSTQPLVDAHN